LRDLGVDGRIMLKGVLKKWVMKEWTGLNWLRLGSDGGSCEHGSELSSF
jgi:hypothetical protein